MVGITFSPGRVTLWASLIRFATGRMVHWKSDNPLVVGPSDEKKISKIFLFLALTLVTAVGFLRGEPLAAVLRKACETASVVCSHVGGVPPPPSG